LFWWPLDETRGGRGGKRCGRGLSSNEGKCLRRLQEKGSLLEGRGRNIRTNLASPYRLSCKERGRRLLEWGKRQKFLLRERDSLLLLVGSGEERALAGGREVYSFQKGGYCRKSEGFTTVVRNRQRSEKGGALSKELFLFFSVGGEIFSVHWEAL